MRLSLLVLLFASLTVEAQQFQSPVYYQVGHTQSLAQGSATADFNNDGIPDIAVATSGGQLSVLPGAPRFAVFETWDTTTPYLQF